MDYPLISCVTPTTARRNKFLPILLQSFHHQDYPNKELVVVSEDDIPLPRDPNIRLVKLDKFENIGTKRNIACQNARGEIVVHFDSDDYYEPQRLTDMLTLINSTGKSVVGYSNVSFYDVRAKKVYGRRDGWEEFSNGNGWLWGMTLSYRRSFWEARNFINAQVDEDMQFTKFAISQNQAMCMSGHDKMITINHTDNTWPRPFDSWYDPHQSWCYELTQNEPFVQRFLSVWNKCRSSISVVRDKCGCLVMRPN